MTASSAAAPSSGPPPLVRLLQEFSLEANRYVDSAGGRNDMHRTDLNALAVIMQHTARNQSSPPVCSARNSTSAHPPPRR